jgi:hypothetical protein
MGQIHAVGGFLVFVLTPMILLVKVRRPSPRSYPVVIRHKLPGETVLSYPAPLLHAYFLLLFHHYRHKAYPVPPDGLTYPVVSLMQSIPADRWTTGRRRPLLRANAVLSQEQRRFYNWRVMVSQRGGCLIRDSRCDLPGRRFEIHIWV